MFLDELPLCVSRKNEINMKIYCDESGYTGADLLERSQPYFVYAGVNLNDQITKEIKNYIYSNYQIQNDEIKGKLIVNSSKGRKVIYHIFKNYGKYARIVFDDKKYALAAKIIEYGIEPFLSSNYIFYTSKLNEFLATGLYASFITKDESAESLFADFLLVMRGKISFEESSFNSLSKDNPLIEWLLDIMTNNPEVILDEIKTSEGNPEKWILDLTMTSLLGILTDWSKNGEKLDVTCDNSKVFIDNPVVESFNKMGLIGSRADFLGVKLGFNLVGEIKNADSKDFVELQIADLFSSTVFYCLKNQESKFSKDIMKIVLKDSLCTPETFCVMPKINSYKEEFDEKKYYYYSLMYSIYQDIMTRKK